MLKPLEILKVANQPEIDTSLDLLYQKDQNIPGSVQYSIKRFYNQFPQGSEDIGMMVYHYHAREPEHNYLELRYCSIGNRYCEDKSCSKCMQLPTANCNGKQHTVDVFTFHFTSTFLSQFTHNIKLSNRKDEVLAFKHPSSFTKTF